MTMAIVTLDPGNKEASLEMACDTSLAGKRVYSLLFTLELPGPLWN